MCDLAIPCVLFLAATACGKTASDEPAREQAPEPQAKKVAEPTPAAEAPPCDEAPLKARIDDMRKKTIAYMTPVMEIAKMEGSCDAVEKKIGALDEVSKAFVLVMEDAMAFKANISPACREKAQALGAALTKELEAAFPEANALDEKMRALMERCRTHPGFVEVAQRNLKFMRKKN